MSLSPLANSVKKHILPTKFPTYESEKGFLHYPPPAFPHDNPYILIHEKKITNLEEIFNLLQMVKQQNRPLLIIAEDVEGEALTTLVINNARKLMRNVTSLTLIKRYL